ncbi:MAG: hypothetical protein H6696_10255 [Deferribacteres bacterium]|nr:hypothetical protein [candidate division KSB1 bacterium]MCB9502311.1 hypothetical protein [Deferribacteres bacterium]
MFRQDEDDYKKLYEDFSNTPVKIVLPAIGDSIFIVLNSGRSIACFFDGFDFYQICIKNKRGKRKNLDIAEVKKVVWKNDKIHHYGLEQLFKLENPRLPLYSYIALENDDIPMAISLNELESVEKINPKSNIFAWGVLGLYVDLICVGAYIVYLFRDFGKMN